MPLRETRPSCTGDRDTGTNPQARPRPGTWALHTDLSLDEVNVHLAALEEAGLLGISEEHARATLFLPSRCDGLPLAGRWEPVADRDWNLAWKRGLEPVTVGAVTVAPPWVPRRAGATDHMWIVIEPGQAFGTGHHETTRGCLAALQDDDLAGRRVLDVGTGTGVLAICAARLGAARVVAVDPDPLAVQATAGNVAANRLRGAVEIRQGSVDAAGAGPFDVVVANLDTATLSGLAADLAARLAPRGRVIASGISAQRAGQARRALVRAGLRPQARAAGDWVVLVAAAPWTPPAPHARDPGP